MSRMSQSATMRNKCHPLVLALMFCTFVFCTFFQSISSQGLCVKSDDAMRWLVSWDLHHNSKSIEDVFVSILNCARIGFWHIWALYWNLGRYVVVVPVHISHKVCVIRFSND